jgi:hypothetical protein
MWGGHLKEHVYAIPRRTIEDFVGRFQAAVTTVNANTLRRVRERAVRCPVDCFEMDGGGFEHVL